LFDLIFGEAALKLALEDAAGVVGTDLRQGADLYDKVGAGAKAGLDLLDFASFQQDAETIFGRLQGCFVQLSALKEIDVLTSDGRQFVFQVLPTVQVAT
jgi:hypothetical protein